MGQAAASSQRRTAALASRRPRRARRYIEAVVAEDTPRNGAQGVGGDGGGQAQTRLWGRASRPVQLGRARRCAARGHSGTCSSHAYLAVPKNPALPSPSSSGASGHPGVSSAPVTPAPPAAPGLLGFSAALSLCAPPPGWGLPRLACVGETGVRSPHPCVLCKAFQNSSPRAGEFVGHF